jgi:hypothetical protein
MNDETQRTATSDSRDGGLPEHAKVVERIIRLDDRLGELRRHL